MKNIPYNTLQSMKQVAKEKKYIEAANKSRFKKMVEKYMKKGIRTYNFLKKS
jgi:hypothetical protein